MADECDIAGQYMEFMDTLRVRRSLVPAPSIPSPATTCAACGVRIPAKRLKIIPDTELCFDCQNMSETRDAARRRNFR